MTIEISDKIWLRDPNESRGIFGRWEVPSFWSKVKALFALKPIPKKRYIPGWVDLWGERAKDLKPYQWTMFDEFTGKERICQKRLRL